MSMRYYGLLLALTLGVPVIAVYYDTHRHYFNKIFYLLHQFGKGMKSCVSLTRLMVCHSLRDYVIVPKSKETVRNLCCMTESQINADISRMQAGES